MSIDLSKYKFFKAGNKTIAVSTYAGKTVRGIATCDPRDSFNEAKGRELAAARCNVKVARKRVKRASQKYEEAIQIFRDAQNYCDQMYQYYEDSTASFEKAIDDHNDIVREMQ